MVKFFFADIIFECVLREIRKTEILANYPNIEKYRLKCQSRSAFIKVINEYEERLGIVKGGAL